MTDLYHFWGGDLAAGSGGDLMPVDAGQRNQMRILRRLMTNPLEGDMPADYPFHPDYGAGLPRKVGEAADLGKIESLIRGQVLTESFVVKNPEPDITVNKIPNGVNCNIRYTDSETSTPQLLSFNVKS